MGGRVKGVEGTRGGGSCCSLYFFLDSLLTDSLKWPQSQQMSKAGPFLEGAFLPVLWDSHPSTSLLSRMSNSALFSQESDTCAQQAALEPSYLPCYLAYGKFSHFFYHLLEARLSHCCSLCPCPPPGERQASDSLFPKLQGICDLRRDTDCSAFHLHPRFFP